MVKPQVGIFYSKRNNLTNMPVFLFLSPKYFIQIEIYIYIYIFFVRLNLFNHVLALFCTKFACILAIRYSVFR